MSKLLQAAHRWLARIAPTTPKTEACDRCIDDYSDGELDELAIPEFDPRSAEDALFF